MPCLNQIGMLELLFVVALLSWVAIHILLYLAALPAAATLLAGTILIPLLAWWQARALTRRPALALLRTRRRPIPPERFYWPHTRRRLGWRLLGSTMLALAAWPVALAFPAQAGGDAASLIGWASGALAILASAEAIAALRVYVMASQRFDRLKPDLVGWLRQGLYRLSDNHEFLGEEPLPREKKQRESVY